MHLGSYVDAHAGAGWDWCGDPLDLRPQKTPGLNTTPVIQPEGDLFKPLAFGSVFEIPLQPLRWPLRPSDGGCGSPPETLFDSGLGSTHLGQGQKGCLEHLLRTTSRDL